MLFIYLSSIALSTINQCKLKCLTLDMSRYVHPTMFSLFSLTLLFSLASHLLSPPDGNIGEVDGVVIDSR